MKDNPYNTQYDEIIAWSEMYDTAGYEAKKMIVFRTVQNCWKNQ